MAEPTPARTYDEIIDASIEALRQARIGLEDLTGPDPERHLPGLRVGIIVGRTVTFPLQKLKHPDDETDDLGHGPWYRVQVRQRLIADPVARAMVRLRNKVEKEGILRCVHVIQRAIVLNPGLDIGAVLDMTTAMTNHQPPFAVDDSGVVRDASGAAVQTPGLSGVATPVYGLADMPEAYAQTPAAQLLEHYLDVLGEIVQSAHDNFGA